jgi:hypothetical protein
VIEEKEDTGDEADLQLLELKCGVGSAKVWDPSTRGLKLFQTRPYTSAPAAAGQLQPPSLSSQCPAVASTRLLHLPHLQGSLDIAPCKMGRSFTSAPLSGADVKDLPHSHGSLEIARILRYP